MSRKFKLGFVTSVILLIAIITIAAARGYGDPLTQTGMDMPTETMQPRSTASAATPQMQDTPTPLGNNIEQNAPSPTWTSIFTGFTPYPNSTSTYNSSMGGSGMMGGCSGMSSGGSMGSGGMVSMGTGGMGMNNGVITGTMGMNSMGGMGSGGMGTGNCSMMSGSGMSGSGMSSSEMSSSGMSSPGMSDGYMLGMDMSGVSGYVEDNSSSVFSDPWLLIGWVLLGLLVIAILVGAGFGIAWIVHRSRQIRPT